MHSLVKISVLIVAASTAGVVPESARQANTEKYIALQSFEFLGCSGQWEEESFKPNAWRLTKNNQVSFLVRHPGTCGIEGRDPKAVLVGGNLELSYELHSPDDTTVLCDCEYWARFSFGESALQIRKVTFNGESVGQRGDWPSGP
jgi:hypothetical protein